MPEYYPINLTQMLPSKLFLVNRSFALNCISVIQYGQCSKCCF